MPNVLEGLNPEQKQAVTHGEGPLLIVAGAGTGKTTVITRRIAYLIEQGLKPEAILALAFGDKAAQEMAERADQLLPYGYYNLQISTFHSFCEGVLKEYGLEVGLPDFRILDEVGQWLLIRNNFDQFDLDYYRPLGNPTRFIKALVQHFARCKDELITPEEYMEYAEKQKLSHDIAPELSKELDRIQEVANAYHTYQRLLLKNSTLDFGDLINYTLKLFQNRPRVLEIYRKRFEYILVDEFQDTNFAQYELLKLLAAPRNNLTVVGDDDQSIFKFRGASISNILHFQKDYSKARFISIIQNYRSTQNILDLAYKFIQQNNPDRLEVKLKISKRLKSSGKEKGVIESVKLLDYHTEASYVISQILKLKKDNPELSWNDFAILARSNEALEPFIDKLEEENLPYIYFANQGLYRKSIIVDLVAYFRLLDNYHESVALYRVLNFPVFGISPQAIIEFNHYAKKKSISLYEAIKQAAALKISNEDLTGIHKLLSLLEKHNALAREKTALQVFIEAVNNLEFSRLATEDTPQSLQNARYLQSFYRKLQNFQTESPALPPGQPDKSLKTFMEQINFEIEAGSLGELEFDPEAGPEAIKLVTVHGAKGLEFTYVFVIGLVDKRFPTVERQEPIEIPEPLIKDILPEGDIHLEEERRLFYVAMTRAKNGLYLTRALDYGGKLTKKPSRFLIELGLASPETQKPTGKVEFVGAPQKVKLPVPKYFSFSQISLFRSCPLEYKYRYILGLPVPGAASLSFGQTIHITFERFLRLLKQEQNQRDLFGRGTSKLELPAFEILEKFYEKSWIDDWYESKTQKDQYRKEGRKILVTFYEELKKNLPEPKYLEANFRMKLLDGVWFMGKIDRGDQTAEGLVIIDYKTGQARPIAKVDKEQLLIYQWAAEEFFKEKVADLQYWFLRDKLEKRSFVGRDSDIADLKKDIQQTVKEVIEATKNNSFAELDHRISHECEYRQLEA